MSNNVRLQQVTRIRGELKATSHVKSAVDQYLEVPTAGAVMSMYTTAQAIVDQQKHRLHEYDASIHELTMRTKALARTAFTLSEPLKLRRFKDGSGRLFFTVREQEYLDLVSGEISALSTLEKPAEDNMLYVELGRGALRVAEDEVPTQLRDIHEVLTSRLRHPTSRWHMTASGLGIVMQDMIYPVSKPDLPLSKKMRD